MSRARSTPPNPRTGTPSLLHSWRYRSAALLRTMLRRRGFESDMDEEIRFHIDQRTDELIAQGLPVNEARRQARVEFGGPESHRDGMRQAFGLRWLDELAADLRYSTRLLRKSPGFTFIAVASLALAIGANTTIFSVANQMLFERLHVPQPRDLRVLTVEGDDPLLIHSSWGSRQVEDGRDKESVLNYRVFRSLQQGSHTLASIAGFKTLEVTVTDAGDAQPVDALLASGNLYETLQVQPQLGRVLQPTDDSLSSAPVVVLSDGFWRRAFSGSPAALGRTVNVNGTTFTIIGVNPSGFTGPENVQISPDLFLPIAFIDQLHEHMGREGQLESSTLWWVEVIGRAKPGVPDAAVSAELDVLLAAAARSLGPIQAGDHMPHVVVQDGSHGMNTSAFFFRKPLTVLGGMVLLVLLLACANVANLLLARSAARSRELSVRLALGAGRNRIFRQVLTESLLLAIMGGTLGLLLGFAGRNLLPRLMQNPWERQSAQITFDWHVFTFTTFVTLATGILFGILPALYGTRQPIGMSLKETGGTHTRRRRALTGKALVSFQIALSTLLVAASALFVRTLWNLTRIDTGFRVPGLVEFSLNPPSKKYAGMAGVVLMQQLEEALKAIPGIDEVSFSQTPLLSDSNSESDFYAEGAPRKPWHRGDTSSYSDLDVVGERFFPTMGTPILEGRGFGPQDTATSTTVSIINASAARQFFAGTNPVGRRFRMNGPKDAVWYTVVGVCADTLYNTMRHAPQPLHFDLYSQQKDMLGGTFMLRTRIPLDQLEPQLRRAVASVNRDLPLLDLKTFQHQIEQNLRQERLFASLTAGFGVLALLLACVGIYGIMAYTVSQRTNEIGIRLALGAQRGQVRAMVLREAALLTVAGVAAGLGVALACVHLVKSMLYGLKPHDPVSLTAAPLLLLAVALLASWLPAARASRVEPMIALRHE